MFQQKKQIKSNRKRNRGNRLAVGGLLLTALLLSGCGKAETGAQENGGIQTEAGSEAGAEEKKEGSYGRLPEFTAKDLDGNTVTNDIFSEKDLTVINIWGTFCSPCIEEMPELGEWAKEMPDNVQIVGLICDISGEEDTEHFDLAAEITESAGADYVQIVANEDFKDILSMVYGVPTTLFVDQDGVIVGEAVVGAYVDKYKDFVEDYLKEQE